MFYSNKDESLVNRSGVIEQIGTARSVKTLFIVPTDTHYYKII